MFSVETIALSTSRPTASINPIMVAIFSVKPPKYRVADAVRMESGTDMITTKVVGKLRMNKYRTIKAKKAPHNPVVKRLFNEEEIICD